MLLISCRPLRSAVELNQIPCLCLVVAELFIIYRPTGDQQLIFHSIFVIVKLYITCGSAVESTTNLQHC